MSARIGLPARTDNEEAGFYFPRREMNSRNKRQKSEGRSGEATILVILRERRETV
jgi:hypothetical protein